MQTTTTVAANSKKASELGCALDVDLDTGRGIHAGDPTDDTAKLQAYLSTATATNPITLVMDGAALITGLQLSAAGYTTIVGDGDTTGFYVKTGSNNDGIHNRPAGYVNDPGPPAPARIAQQVTLKAFRLNGNRGDGHTGNSVSGDPHGGSQWLFGINLMDMEQVVIDQVTVLHASVYSIRLSNVGHAKVTNCRIMPFNPVEPVTLGTNTDGVHVNGPANDIEISGCYFRTGDDGIALNAPEGHTGNIQRVTATNCMFDGCITMMRIYTQAGAGNNLVVSDVTASGFTGTATSLGILLGNFGRGAPVPVKDSLRNILIQNCQIRSDFAVVLSENVVDLSLRGVIWTGNDFPSAMVASIDHSITVRTLAMNTCTVMQTPDHNQAFALLDLRDNGDFASVVEVFTVDGIVCADAPGTSKSLECLVAVGKKARIGSIVVTDVDARKIPKLAYETSDWTQIGQVSGPGLLKTGWTVPDGKVKKLTAYVSDETNMPALHDGERLSTLAWLPKAGSEA